MPKLVAGAKAAADAVLEISQGIVPVDTGELKASGRTETEWVGHAVTGLVIYDAPYAAYVEFGTGARGASSAGSGPFLYDLNWPGMVAQPYCRPALDQGRAEVLDAFKTALGS